MGIFLRGVGEFFKNCYIFTYTCPNGSGVGAIDRSDPFEHVFDPYCTLEVLRKIFTDEVWVICPQKPSKNGLFCLFIRVLYINPYKLVKKTIFRGFLRTDHSNLVHENFSEDFQYRIWVENMFRWIRSINRTNSRSIWTRICEDIAILEKLTQPPPLKKKIPT